MDKDNAMNMDSGTESLCESKTEETPIPETISDDEEEDETVAERIWGLTEMFPESIRRHTNNLINITKKAVVKSYSFACNYTWFISTTGTLLVMPFLFENERNQIKEAQAKSSKKLLFGIGNENGSLGNGTTILPY